MFREVDKRTAVNAAMDGKLVLQYSKAPEQRGGKIGDCVFNLTAAFNASLCEGDRYILDDPEDGAKEPESVSKEPEADQNEEKPDPSTPEADQAPRQNKPGPKPVDGGKIKALYNAGWGIEEIAREMHCSVTTVKRYL